MELGTVLFYANYDDFAGILKHMKVDAEALSLSDEKFQQEYGYDRQSLFHVLYQSNDMWGFLCKTITDEDRSVSYKILDSHNRVKTINESEVYFALTMDDFTYTHWAEMENEKKIKTSSQGTAIMKKPSNSSIQKAKKVKRIFGMGFKMLYQIVCLNDGNPSYPQSNPFNSQWKDYDPYKPTQNPYDYMMKSSWMPNTPYPKNPAQQGNWNHPSTWWNHGTTFHAVPYMRDNLKPTKFSVALGTASAANDLRMFVNFPQGLPLTFA